MDGVIIIVDNWEDWKVIFNTNNENDKNITTFFTGNFVSISGGRIKTPTPCDSLSILRPICIAGGEQTLFVVTPDGKLYATGYNCE